MRKNKSVKMITDSLEKHFNEYDLNCIRPLSLAALKTAHRSKSANGVLSPAIIIFRETRNCISLRGKSDPSITSRRVE